MTSSRSDDKEFIYFKVLTFLKENPDLLQREMAQRLGISNGGMHYCLNALMDNALIELGNFPSSWHKLGYFCLTLRGIAQKTAMTSRFLERKMAEYVTLCEEIEALKRDADLQARASSSKAAP